MGEANIVSFEKALKARRAPTSTSTVLTDEDLRRRQRSVPLEDCHAAFERVSVQIALKTRKFTLFHDLSAGFPKGRRIAILGHKGSGKSTLFELLLKSRFPNRGRVIVGSRLSFPVHRTDFLDQRLSLRDNLIFTSRILGVDARRVVWAAQRFCDIEEHQLKTRMKELPGVVRRRAGLVVVLAADFDCHLIDGGLNPRQYGVDGAALEALERAVFGRDYIFTTGTLKQMPANCDLAYLLYDGRLYYFEDVAVAMEVFAALPIPLDPGGGRKKDEDDEDDETNEDAVY